MEEPNSCAATTPVEASSKMGANHVAAVMASSPHLSLSSILAKLTEALGFHVLTFLDLIEYPQINLVDRHCHNLIIKYLINGGTFQTEEQLQTVPLLRFSALAQV